MLSILDKTSWHYSSNLSVHVSLSFICCVWLRVGTYYFGGGMHTYVCCIVRVAPRKIPPLAITTATRPSHNTRTTPNKAVRYPRTRQPQALKEDTLDLPYRSFGQEACVLLLIGHRFEFESRRISSAVTQLPPESTPTSSPDHGENNVKGNFRS